MDWLKNARFAEPANVLTASAELARVRAKAGLGGAGG